jgi:flagellar hook assembly protein FlgD
LSLSKQAFTTADAGVVSVILTVQDSSKNKSTCTAQVTVEKYTGIEPNQVLSGFDIYPNPVSSSTNIKFELAQETQVEIGLFDLEGKLIETIIKAQKPAGENNFLWNSSNLSSGAYIISLKAENGQIERKMLIKQ